MRFKWPIMLIAVLLIMIATCRNANGQEEEDGEPETSSTPETTLPMPTPDNETSTTPENSTTPGPEEKHYGLGGHTYDGKIMYLAAGSEVLNQESTPEELKNLTNYRNSGTGEFQGKGCSVSIEGDYFVVHYDKEAAEHGCAVDLLMKKSHKIETLFTVEVTSDDGFLCMTTATEYEEHDILPNDNIIPFVYSIDNAAVQELQKGPRYSENNDCNVEECKKRSDQGRCIESTALEIRWGQIYDLDDPETKSKSAAWLQPVAEPKNIRLPGVKDKTGKATVNVNGKAEAEVYNIEGYCTLKEAVPEPMAWDIDNNGEHLFVFHLLPQNATRIYRNDKMTDDPPKGLNPCESLTIKFHSDYYRGIVITNATEPMSTNGNTTTAQENTTTTPETPEATSTPIWPFVAGGIGALVLLIIAAVLIYCFCCRKKKEETEDEESAALEDGNKNTKTKTTIVDEGNESKVVDEDADAGSRADAKKMSGSATASRGASLAAESEAEYSNLEDVVPTDMKTEAT